MERREHEGEVRYGEQEVSRRWEEEGRPGEPGGRGRGGDMSGGSGEALTADRTADPEQGEAEYSGVQVLPTPLSAWGGGGGQWRRRW